MDGVTLSTTALKEKFTTAVKSGVATILNIEQSAVSIYSTYASVRRRLTEVSDSRNLHGAEAGTKAVYTVTMSGTTKDVIQSSLTTNKNAIVTALSNNGFSGATVRDAEVVEGSPSSSTTSSKSSAPGGTTLHVAIMICALAAVTIQSTLL